MSIFEQTTRPDADLFCARDDKNDPRLGELVSFNPEHYGLADIVILGCPQDDGVRRSQGRVGAAEAPDKIREQFYKLTPFSIKKKIFDIGNIVIGSTLENTHSTHTAVVQQILRDGKRVIVLGGGNDVSYPDGVAMAEVYGAEWWIGVNIGAQLDVCIADERNNRTSYRQLLEGGHLLPEYFYEVAYQTHFASSTYYSYIRELGVNRISLELLRSHADVDTEIKEQIRKRFIGHSSSLNTFFGFDLNAVRSADAPGTSSPSPLGIRAGEFIQLVKYAASLVNTKIIEFTEVNPKYDQDDRTTTLVAIGMHRFCSGVT